MNIIHKLKRVFAVVATVALLATNASVAFAQTFNDVPTDAWYFDYVEQLVDEGVFDVADNFRPDAPLNRAELVKIVITAIDGLAGYEAPATPTFDDVSASAWFYDYVEAAVQLDIVNGYTDASGNLTGLFGPSDTVNRAAATKILVNAFSVPTDLEPVAPFSDVASSAWFYDYVTTAYNQSILDGYENGKFGPADPVTRAQVAKLVVNSQNPFERAVATTPTTPATPTTPETPTTPTTPASTGDLEVSLNDNTSASSTLPLSSSSVSLASFDLTAADDDVVLTNFTVTRGGVGQVTDWTELFLYEGSNRLTTGRTINNDTNVATFPVSLTVSAGTTRTVRVVGNVAASGTANANNQHYFYLASAADVTTNAQSVAGDFPVAGSTFTIGGVSVNTLTVTAGSTPSQPLIGAKDAEIASFKTQAGSTNDVAVHEVTLTQNGSLSTDRLQNLRLLRGNDEVATTAAFASKERVTFVLDTPFVVPEGQTKTWYIRSDIDGGRTTDDIQLYLDETSDIVAIDQQYGHGAAITNSYTGVSLSLKGGKVTVTDNGPSATQIAQNVTNVSLLDYSITTDRDLTVRDATVTVTITDGTNTPDVDADLTMAAGTCTVTGVAASGTNYDITTSSDCADDAVAGDMMSITVGSTVYYARVVSNDGTANVGGGLIVASGSDISTLTSGTILELNPYAYLKNVRVVDLDTGGTLQGPLTLGSQGTKSAVTDTVYRKKFTEDYELAAGESRHLSIQVDTDQYLPAGYQVSALISYSTDDTNAAATGYIKDFAANQDISASDIVGDNLTGKSMTVAANSLTVGLSASPNPTNTSYIKGQTGVKAVGFNFTAGDAGAINIKKLTFRLVADDDGDFDDDNTAPALGDIAAQTVISAVSLYDGNDLIGAPAGLSVGDGGTWVAEADYYKAEFDDLSIVIPAGGSKTLTVQLNLLNSVTGQKYAAVYMVAADDVVAEDKDANSTTASGGTINDQNTSDSYARLVTIAESGTLTVREQSSPQASLVVAGATQQLVATYEFAAAKEAFDVHEFTVINDLSSAFDTETDTSSVQKVWVEYPDVNGVMQTSSQSLVSGAANFSGLSPALYVPKDGVAVVKVYADVQSTDYGQTLSGARFRLGMQDDNTDSTDGTFRAFGGASGESVYAPTITGAANVYEHIVRFTKPTITLDGAGSGALTSGETNLYAAKVTADPSRGLEVKRIIFNLSSVFTAATDDLHTFRVREGLSSSDLTSAEATIVGRSAAGAQAVSLYTYDASDATSWDGIDGTDDGADTGYVIVTFTTPRTISAGASKTFVLRATVVGASATGEQVSTSIDDDTVNNYSASAGAASMFQGCYYFVDPSAVTDDDAYVITDLDCDGASDTGEYALNVSGFGNGTTGVAATGQDLDMTGYNGVLRGALSVMDPLIGTDDDHFFWFDVDVDGVVDTTEITLYAHTTAGDITALDATAASGITGRTLSTGTTYYGRVNVGYGFMLHDFAAGAGQAVAVINDGDLTDAAIGYDAGEIGIDLLGETDDLTAVDDVYIGGGTLPNFLWSDKSSTSPSHSEYTTDWTSGYLVETLSSPSRVLSY